MTALVLQPRISGTTVTTGKCRASYVHVFEPQPERNPKPGAKPKYSISLLVPKSDKATLQMLAQALKEAGEAKFGPKFMEDYKKPGSRYKKAIRDGDTERDDPAYAGHYFINCRSNQRPPVLGRDLTHITNPADFRSGDYCRATINAFAYDNESKGVSFGLIHLQKVESGEPLGATGPAPESVYDAIPGGETPAEGGTGDDDFPL